MLAIECMRTNSNVAIDETCSSESVPRFPLVKFSLGFVLERDHVSAVLAAQFLVSHWAILAVEATDSASSSSSFEAAAFLPLVFRLVVLLFDLWFENKNNGSAD